MDARIYNVSEIKIGALNRVDDDTFPLERVITIADSSGGKFTLTLHMAGHDWQKGEITLQD